MDCEFDYCINNKNFKCQYDSVSINGYGMCNECMVVSIKKYELQRMKEKQLEEFEIQWENDTNAK